MRSRVLALACVAACGGEGLDIEVRSDADFDAVELYIAYDKCPDCEGVAWPSSQDRAPGDVYLLSDDERVIRTTDLVGKTAQLHLEAAAGFAQTTAIGVVAYKGSEVVGIRVLYDKTIPRGDAEKWQVDLRAITPAKTDVTTPPASGQPAYRAFAWPREASSALPDPAGYAGCLAYQEWNGEAWKTQYFVPATDTDCDGTPPDCDPLWAHRPLGSAKCVTKPTAAGLMNTCVLGARTCLDETSQQACTASTTPLICVPSGVCTACADSDNLASCLKDVISTAVNNNPGMSPVPSMRCEFIPDPLAPMPNGPCAQVAAQGAERLTFKMPGTCSTGTGNAVLRPITTPFSGGSPTMVIGGTASMTIHATPGLGFCDIQIDWTQGEGNNPQIVVAAVQYGMRQVLVPVAISFRMATCPTSPGACLQQGDWPNEPNGTVGDSVFACTAP